MFFRNSRLVSFSLSLLILASMMMSGLVVEARATDLVPESETEYALYRKVKQMPASVQERLLREWTKRRGK